MRTGMRKLPRSSVKPANTVPVASCTARTATPGRTPEVESLTVPEMVASWANTAAGSARQDNRIKMNGRTSPRPIADLLPQAFVTDKRMSTVTDCPGSDDDPLCSFVCRVFASRDCVRYLQIQRESRERI